MSTHHEAARATILRRVPLAWRDRATAAAAGTPHPRAASGLALHHAGAAPRLALVQDDAPCVALVDPQSGLADALRLTWHGAVLGAESYEKAHKPDLECCTTVTHAGRTLVLAFGSGSTAARERVAVIAGDARLLPAHGLYAALREALGPGLNIEGALALREHLWLFQRGNGGAEPGLAALALADLFAHLAGGPTPALSDVRRVHLGALDGVPLGFTDAAVLAGDRIAWCGSAEASPDTYQDGHVTGSVIGLLDLASDGGPRVASTLRLYERDGRAFSGKAEGLAPGDGGRLWVCADPDDPDVPAELLEVALP